MIDGDLKIASRVEGSERVVVLGGEVSVSSVFSLVEALRSVTDAGESTIVDLSGVRYLDSQGIRALRTAYQQAIASGGAFRIRGCRGVVERAIRLVGLDRIVPVD